MRRLILALAVPLLLAIIAICWLLRGETSYCDDRFTGGMIGAINCPR